MSVRLVYIDDAPARVDGPVTDYTINWWYTLQQAVRAKYPAFPGVCMWVVRMRGPDRVHLWERSQDASAFDEQNFYPTLRSGDEIEIYVNNRQPRGPKASVSGGAGGPPRDGRSDRGHGPWCGPDGKHACVGCMLATLARVSEAGEAGDSWRVWGGRRRRAWVETNSDGREDTAKVCVKKGRELARVSEGWRGWRGKG